MSLLELNNLHVSFKTRHGEIKAVRGVDFWLDKAETLAIVGESGSGKSVTAQSVIGMIPRPHGRINEGRISFKGEDITKLPIKQYRKIRGKQIGMVFQDPMTALNPTMKIGHQIQEVFTKKLKQPKKLAKESAIKLLEEVGIKDPVSRYSDYPHQFSGGMTGSYSHCISSESIAHYCG